MADEESAAADPGVPPGAGFATEDLAGLDDKEFALLVVSGVEVLKGVAAAAVPNTGLYRPVASPAGGLELQPVQVSDDAHGRRVMLLVLCVAGKVAREALERDGSITPELARRVDEIERYFMEGWRAQWQTILGSARH